MNIKTDFPGANIEIISSNNKEVVLEREIRQDNGYFYWAFCVNDANGQTVTFKFPNNTRVGYYGAAVSHDLINWSWSETKFTYDGKDGFTYSFSENEKCVYFAHNMVYTLKSFEKFIKDNNISVKTLCKSRQGRNVPYFTLGSGTRKIIITSRHHACESTGTYVLQGFAQECLNDPVNDIEFIFIPFVDYDGVCNGDAGKGRLPHDHNRDYAETIYPEIKAIKNIIENNKIVTNFDFHSPHHCGWINDYPYFMRCDGENSSIYNDFSRTLSILTEKSGLKYTGNEDIKYGDRYNETDIPNMLNYILPFTELKYSFLMEIPYFGTKENKFSVDKAITLGKMVYKSAKIYF